MLKYVSDFIHFRAPSPLFYSVLRVSIKWGWDSSGNFHWYFYGKVFYLAFGLAVYGSLHAKVQQVCVCWALFVCVCVSVKVPACRQPEGWWCHCLSNFTAKAAAAAAVVALPLPLSLLPLPLPLPQPLWRRGSVSRPVNATVCVRVCVHCRLWLPLCLFANNCAAKMPRGYNNNNNNKNNNGGSSWCSPESRKCALASAVCSLSLSPALFGTGLCTVVVVALKLKCRKQIYKINEQIYSFNSYTVIYSC